MAVFLQMRVELDNNDPTGMSISSKKAQVSVKACQSAYFSVHLPFISVSQRDVADIAAALDVKQQEHEDFTVIRGITRF